MSLGLLRSRPHADYINACVCTINMELDIPEEAYIDLAKRICDDKQVQEQLEKYYGNIPVDTRIMEIAEAIKQVVLQYGPYRYEKSRKPILLIGLFNETYHNYSIKARAKSDVDVKKLDDYQKFKQYCEKQVAEYSKDKSKNFVPYSVILNKKTFFYYIRSKLPYGSYGFDDRVVEILHEIAEEPLYGFMAPFKNYSYEIKTKVALASIDANHKIVSRNYDNAEWADDIIKANAEIAILKKQLDVMCSLYTGKTIAEMPEDERRDKIIALFKEVYGDKYNFVEHGGVI